MAIDVSQPENQADPPASRVRTLLAMPAVSQRSPAGSSMLPAFPTIQGNNVGFNADVAARRNISSIIDSAELEIANVVPVPHDASNMDQAATRTRSSDNASAAARSVIADGPASGGQSPATINRDAATGESPVPVIPLQLLSSPATPPHTPDTPLSLEQQQTQSTVYDPAAPVAATGESPVPVGLLQLLSSPATPSHMPDTPLPLEQQQTPSTVYDPAASVGRMAVPEQVGIVPSLAGSPSGEQVTPGAYMALPAADARASSHQPSVSPEPYGLEVAQPGILVTEQPSPAQRAVSKPTLPQTAASHLDASGSGHGANSTQPALTSMEIPGVTRHAAPVRTPGAGEPVSVPVRPDQPAHLDPVPQAAPSSGPLPPAYAEELLERARAIKARLQASAVLGETGAAAGEDSGDQRVLGGVRAEHSQAAIERTIKQLEAKVHDLEARLSRQSEPRVPVVPRTIVRYISQSAPSSDGTRAFWERRHASRFRAKSLR